MLIATFSPRSQLTMTRSSRPVVSAAEITPSAGTSQTAQMPLMLGFETSMAPATFSASPEKSGPPMPCSATILMSG